MALTSDWAGSSGWLQWWAAERGRRIKETKKEKKIVEKGDKKRMKDERDQESDER